MKRTIVTTLAFLAVLAVASMAFAQPGGGGGRGPGGGFGGPGGGFGGPGGGFGGGAGLLRNEEVRKELGLSEDQVAQLTKIAEEQREAGRALFQGQGQGGGDRQGPPSAEEINRNRERIEKFADENEGKVNKVLSAEQQGKYKDLRFQLAGGLNAQRLDARTLSAVNLTDEQKAKLKTLQDEQDAEVRKAFESRPQQNIRDLSQEEREKLFAQFRTEGEARQKKFVEKLKGILTAEQVAKAEKLTESAAQAREKLGIPAPGQGGQGNRRGGQGAEGYRPGAGSWQPGQGGRRNNEGGEGRQQRRSFPQQEQQ